MTYAARLDVIDALERARLTRFHYQIVLWSFLVMLMDGFDLQIIGYVAPSLMKEWGTTRAALSAVFSAALVGMMLGATLLGSLGDRLGRKRMIVMGAAVFGTATLVSSLVDTPSALVVLRFLAGVGLGGAVPNAIALNSEYAPSRIRATLVTVMFLGYTLGAALGGFLSAHLIPHFGWRSIFVVGGVVPMLLALAAARYLPESIRFQLLRRKASTNARAILAKVLPGQVGPDTQLNIREETKTGMPARHLFVDGRASMTLLLWTCFIANLITLHFIANWLPTVITGAGVPIERAVLVSALFQVGGTVGGIVISRLLDRGSLVPLVGFFACAAVAIASIGSVGVNENRLDVTVFLAGLFVVGTQFGLNALAGASYPTFIRSTGVGWALGIGRIGSILGPVVGGLLIGMKLPLNQLFIWGALPMLLGSASVLLLIRRQRAAGLAGGAVSFHH